MSPFYKQKMIFNSVFDCLVAGQDRYKELFFLMLEKIENIKELFSEEELFAKIAQLAGSKVQIDVYENFLNKIEDLPKIMKMEIQITGNNIIHLLLKQKVDAAILKLFTDAIQGDLSVLNHKNKQGDTPLHFAVKYARKLNVLEVLLKYKISVPVQNRDKNTPLHYAVLLLSHNRDFDDYVLEQQILIFHRLCTLYDRESLSLKNKYGYTVGHLLIADIDFYRGVAQNYSGFSYEDLMDTFQNKKSESKRIQDFFRKTYPDAVQNIISKLFQFGLNLKEQSDLKYTAFQLAFIKRHFPAIKALYSVGDTFTENDLFENDFAQVALTLAKKEKPQRQESLKIFVQAGGHRALEGTQLGHDVLKQVLVEQLNIDLTDLLMTKAGARILDKDDSNEIWKTLFFKLSHTSDSHFKISTLQILFHIGINYTKKDGYGRNAEELAKLYHIHNEFVQARTQFETYALTQMTRQSKSAAPLYEQDRFFYH
jgi:ankyrin repeat protein